MGLIGLYRRSIIIRKTTTSATIVRCPCRFETFSYPFFFWSSSQPASLSGLRHLPACMNGRLPTIIFFSFLVSPYRNSHILRHVDHCCSPPPPFPPLKTCMQYACTLISRNHPTRPSRKEEKATAFDRREITSNCGCIPSVLRD